MLIPYRKSLLYTLQLYIKAKISLDQTGGYRYSRHEFIQKTTNTHSMIINGLQGGD